MKDVDYISIAKRIVNARKQKNYSQQDLAEYADISIRRMSSIENGNLNINMSTLISLSNALDLSLDYLIFGNTESVLSKLPPSLLEIFSSDNPEDKELFLEYYEIFKKIRNK